MTTTSAPTVEENEKHPTQIKNTDLVDELGGINSMKKALEEREKALKGELKRRGRTYYEGDYFIVNVNERTRTTLNKNAVVDKLGQDWVDGHSTITNYQEVSIQERGD